MENNSQVISEHTIYQAGNREALSLWHKVLLENVKHSEIDLSTRQIALLLTVYLESGPHTVRSLSQHLNVSKPAICRAIDTLSKLSLLAREADKDDRRNVFVVRTDQGSDFLKQFSESILNHLMEIA